ncbi:hypothetical protein [Streptomyces sp. NPDC050528]|uniref:hypothetical protein n=1 Tax=unclassified Streptomyces TaxID=2593676 RepID=UPI0037A80514
MALTLSLAAYAPLTSGLWDLLETVAPLVSIPRTARRAERPATAVTLSAALDPPRSRHSGVRTTQIQRRHGIRIELGKHAEQQGMNCRLLDRGEDRERLRVQSLH